MSNTRGAIIATATDAFLRDGYETSLEKIAADSGVVRQTVYNLFKSKADLFRAVVVNLIAETSPKDLLDFVDEPDPEAALTRIGTNYIALMLNPRSLKMHRVLAAQISLDPDLARKMLAGAIGPLESRLSTYLAQQSQKGLLSVDDPDMAADHFLGMLLGQLHLRATLGLGGEAEAQVRQRVNQTVSAFLRAYRPTAA